MYILEPCCIQRQLGQLCQSIRDGGTAEFDHYGDLSLTELLPALLARYNKTSLLIVAPSVPDQAADIISAWARKQWPYMDGSGWFFVVKHLTIVTSLSESSPSVSRWKNDKAFEERLTLIDTKTDEYAILLSKIAISGFRNMRYGENGTAVITTEADKIQALWEKYEEAEVVEPAAAAPAPVAEPAPVVEEDDSSSSDGDVGEIELIRIID